MEGNDDQTAKPRTNTGTDSSAYDVFLSCVSRFSTNSSKSSGEQLHRSLCGSPAHILETSQNFCPEAFATGAPSQLLYISAILPVANQPRSRKYFITFQQRARQWQRYTVVITFDQSAIERPETQVFAPSNMGLKLHCLPQSLVELLRPRLLDIENFCSVTSLRLNVIHTGTNLQILESFKIPPSEDVLEKRMTDEDKLISNLPHMGCHRFRESQIAFKARISCSRHQVWVDGLNRHCLERKAPFASTGHEGDNMFEDFIDEIEKLNSLRGRAGINQFLGVVFDDAGVHLKGYLCELPVICNLRSFLAFVNYSSELVPWSTREMWIKQIMEAMAHIHAQKLLVGALDLNHIFIHTDGTAVWDLTDCAPRHLPTRRDRLPPELTTNIPNHCNRITNGTVLTYSTDVYQLGYCIWLIAEHRPGDWGHYCTLAKCSNASRYQCTADHAFPLRLPPCSSAPTYIDDVIRLARSPNPKHRPAAKDVARLIEYQDPTDNQAILDHLFEQFSSLPVAFCIFCSNCGNMATYDHYHCYVCQSSDFDLCLPCYAKGIRCWYPQQHELARRGIKLASSRRSKRCHQSSHRQRLSS